MVKATIYGEREREEKRRDYDRLCCSLFFLGNFYVIFLQNNLLTMVSVHSEAAQCRIPTKRNTIL